MSDVVKAEDLKGLFKATVDNLNECIKDRTATPKDKELALKLIYDNQIGIELASPEHLTELDSPLPFNEMEAPQ